jgi:PAS domain S-box-containing protein
MIACGTGTADSRSALGRYLRQYEELRGRHSADLALLNAIRLRRADALIRGVFENSFDAIVIFSGSGQIDAANEGLARLFGRTKAELTGASLFDLFAEGSQTIRAALASLGSSGGYLEMMARRSDGSVFPVEIALGRITLAGDAAFIVIVRDISDRKTQQEKLRHQALHDALTGLPNRVLFCDRL